MTTIPIDFVAGTHGHFLEIILNKFFDITTVDFDPFNELGASHRVEKNYLDSRVFEAQHWFENHVDKLNQCERAISIQFDQDDLLLVSSVSLLRAGDLGIDNAQLDVGTYNKLDNKYYRNVLSEIVNAYPFLNKTDTAIPRNVLREFFKFGFLNPKINGYWKKQQQMQYSMPVFVFKFKAFYNYNLLVDTLIELENFLGMTFRFDPELKALHDKFLNLIPYTGHTEQCNNIVSAVRYGLDQIIPPLTLFQESYINAQLEKIYSKEMPFHDLNYFTSTKDVLYYLNNLAPDL